MSFRFIDLFAGIGGFRLGFEAAGGRCVFTSEIDRHARQVYACNHGGDESAIAGDISEITATDIPEHDMLLAGFPCQAFSIGGQRRGFDDTRGTLFFEIARVLAAGRTKAFCLENVPHLLKHDSGKTFSVITGTLRDLGFHLSFQVVNAAAWVPQKRKRLFLCGHKTNRAFNIDFMPVPNPADGPRLCSILEPHPPQDATLEDAEWKAALEHKARQEAQGRGFGCNIVDPDSVAPTLTARYIANNTILLNPDIEAATLSSATWDAMQKHRAKHQARGNGFGYVIASATDVANTLSARYGKDGSEILIERPMRNPRRLTPRECARLMGFPDTFQIPVAKTHAYRLFGNSIVPAVAGHIAKYLVPEL